MRCPLCQTLCRTLCQALRQALCRTLCRTSHRTGLPFRLFLISFRPYRKNVHGRAQKKVQNPKKPECLIRIPQKRHRRRLSPESSQSSAEKIVTAGQGNEKQNPGIGQDEKSPGLRLILCIAELSRQEDSRSRQHRSQLCKPSASRSRGIRPPPARSH